MIVTTNGGSAGFQTNKLDSMLQTCDGHYLPNNAGARYWPLELGRANHQLHDRQRCLWPALCDSGTRRECESVRLALRRDCNRVGDGLLRRGLFAFRPEWWYLSLLAVHLWPHHRNCWGFSVEFVRIGDGSPHLLQLCRRRSSGVAPQARSGGGAVSSSYGMVLCGSGGRHVSPAVSQARPCEPCGSWNPRPVRDRQYL